MSARLDQRISLLKDNLQELKTLVESFEAVGGVLESLPNKVEHEILVPLCGSSDVLLKGRLCDTNTITVQLGERFFVQRTAKNALENVTKRAEMATAMVNDFQKELQTLQLKAKGIRDLEIAEKDTPNVDLNARESSAKGSAVGSAVPDYDGPGLVRRTAEGFLEIIEHESADDDASSSKKVDSQRQATKWKVASSPLIQELDEPVAQPAAPPAAELVAAAARAPQPVVADVIEEVDVAAESQRTEQSQSGSRSGSKSGSKGGSVFAREFLH